MKTFSVGDKVMHPQYGPGKITGVEHRELVEGFEHYYVIELLVDGSTLFVPMRNIEELGVRPVMSQARLARVFETLRGMPRRLSKDFKVRQARVRKKLATARPIKLAEVVRDLTGRNRRSYLTKVDRALLDRGRELLASEVAAVSGIEVIYAHQEMDAALKATMSDKEQEPERRAPTTPSREFTRETLVEKLLKRVKQDAR
jgi:CarD family transcriptional regulator